MSVQRVTSMGVASALARDFPLFAARKARRYIRVHGLYIAMDIYLQGTCITRGEEAWWKRSAERSLGKLVAAALPLIYGNRRDSYGKVTAERSIKRRAACPRESATARGTNRKSRNRNRSPRLEKEEGTRDRSERLRRECLFSRAAPRIPRSHDFRPLPRPRATNGRLRHARR